MLPMTDVGFFAVVLLATAPVIEGEGEGDSVVVRAKEDYAMDSSMESPLSGRADHADHVGETTSGPYCPPREFVWGTYTTTVTGCVDAGGDWVLASLSEEEESDEQDGESRREQLVISREDVQSLLVNSGSLVVQPDQAWVLVNTDTIVLTDAVEHTIGTQVLGLDIDVRVTPVLFTWDYGDGSPPVTGTDPGAPWPNHTVSHLYDAAGTVTISLRTEWDAAFRVEGTSTWLPVSGRAVTVTTTDPIEVVTATPRLTG